MKTVLIEEIKKEVCNAQVLGAYNALVSNGTIESGDNMPKDEIPATGDELAKKRAEARARMEANLNSEDKRTRELAKQGLKNLDEIERREKDPKAFDAQKQKQSERSAVNYVQSVFSVGLGDRYERSATENRTAKNILNQIIQNRGYGNKLAMDVAETVLRTGKASPKQIYILGLAYSKAGK